MDEKLLEQIGEVTLTAYSRCELSPHEQVEVAEWVLRKARIMAAIDESALLQIVVGIN